MMRACVLAVWFASAALAQLSMSVQTDAGLQPAGALVHVGTIYQGQSSSAVFQLRNVSNLSTNVTVLKVEGTGFSITSVPPLPVRLEPQGFFSFSVVFQGSAPGSYSAALQADGVSVLLTATIQRSLTYLVDSITLGATAVAFGPVELPGSVTKQVRIENRESQVQTVPPISVTGPGFQLTGPSPSGIALQPGQSAGFDLQFTPRAAGTSEGVLRLGDRTFALSGSALDPPLPKASVLFAFSTTLQSALQLPVTVVLDTPARSSGLGTLTIDFEPSITSATDPGIVFANGSRSVTFQVSPGDTRPFTTAFQTGTTAGTLGMTVSLGGNSSRVTIPILPAPPVLAGAQAIRSANAIELRLTGYDNSRTAGAAAYTFFDSAGTQLAEVRVDHTADFARHFQTSDVGGNFLLRSVFPVTGDAARIASFAVLFTTGSGVANISRTPIP